MPPAVAALKIGVGSCWGEACGGMLEAMVRIASLQPNEAMARIATRKNGTISLDPSCRVKILKEGSLDVDSKLFSRVQIDSKSGLRKSGFECKLPFSRAIYRSISATRAPQAIACVFPGIRVSLFLFASCLWF